MKGELCAEGIPLKTLARKYGTPLYVYSAGAFSSRFQELKKGLSSLDHLICFAVKANSNLAILKHLAKEGAGMDLVSGGELYRALEAGVSPKKIVFSGVGKSADEMAVALRAGIHSFNVESSSELVLLDRVARKLKKKAPVAIRFNPDVDPKTHPHISTGLKQNKFGIEKSEVLAIAGSIQMLRQIEFKGISIHIGSQLTSLAPLDQAYERTRELIEKLNRILPEPLSFVDLGGGLGITYKDEKPPEASAYCKLILKHFGPKNRTAPPLRVLIEPGRSIAGNSGVLVSQVLHRKENAGKDFLIVDAAMNDLMRPALYDGFHDILPLEQKLNRGKKTKIDVVGPVCESTDCLAGDRRLSNELKSGDLIALMSAGAYGFSMANNYNSRPKPAEILVKNKNARVIRKREIYADLIRGERF